MRIGTWLKPMVYREPLLSHYLPGHVLNTPVAPEEQTRCHKRADQLPAAAMIQDWRVVYGSAWTCQECASLLLEDDTLDGV